MNIDRDLIAREQVYLINDSFQNRKQYNIPKLIELFTDVGEVVIDPCAGSGTTLLAALQTNRRAYGFEIKKEFVKNFNEILIKNVQLDLLSYG